MDKLDRELLLKSSDLQFKISVIARMNDCIEALNAIQTTMRSKPILEMWNKHEDLYQRVKTLDKQIRRAEKAIATVTGEKKPFLSPVADVVLKPTGFINGEAVRDDNAE